MRERVVILGGGVGGVAAAWELSRTAALRARFEVTVVQPGWRLGGKGATGRDAARGQRIHEHGLHLWLGFYRHAFRMVRDLYDAWEGPKTGPQSSIESAFSPLSDIVLMGGTRTVPEAWRLSFPPLPGVPWDDAPDLSLTWPTAVWRWARALEQALAPTPNAGGWTRARLATLAGLTAALARGVLSNVAELGRGNWEALDHEDLRAWLRRHGASDAVADAPPIRALYDLAFAYPDGIAGPGRGELAAGAALKTLLSIFLKYRGAPFWRMNAGMGDTVFAPAYEVLSARGVRFAFFRRVERLEVAADLVDSIELAKQAEGSEAYAPLIDVGPLRAWPDAPLAERVARLAPGDLEADDGPSLGAVTLRRGRDFDKVVLAIPPASHPRIARALIEASPRFRAMVENSCAVPTIAAQWWLRRPAGALGWPGTAPVLTGIPGLFRTWADLGEVVDAEAWAERPATVAYFCNVAPAELHGMTDRAAARRWVAERAQAWADGPLLDLWPKCRAADGTFDAGVLHAPVDVEPLGFQYARANVALWERYVLTRPGSTRHRLAPDESGFTNLLLAGDWTRNAINGGSVEAAASSGVAAGASIARGRERVAPAALAALRLFA
jgi:uncharacterized protein with NAD-binding domain and iron-sulfur cluster